MVPLSILPLESWAKGKEYSRIKHPSGLIGLEENLEFWKN